MTKAWKILLKMPKGDDRPPRWVTLVADLHDKQAASKAARGTFGPGRVLVIREGAA